MTFGKKRNKCGFVKNQFIVCGHRMQGYTVTTGSNFKHV